jgi:transposase
MDLTGLGKLLCIESPWRLKDVKVQSENQVIDVFIDYERGSKFSCPQCGKESPVHDSSYKRVRHLDVFEYRCYLNIKTPRISCDKDGIKVTHTDKWSRQGTHYSFKLEALILRLCKEMSMTAVSVELGEPDNNLWRVFHHHVSTKIINNFDFRDVRYVCVDETAIKRGHNYISIFTDYDTGNVLFVTEGRKKEVFSLFYGWLWDKGGHPGNIELFSMDMSKSYQAGQRGNFAEAEVVFDRFHIKKCLNKSIDTVRKNEVIKLNSLKNTKYIWLKNEENLTEKQKVQLDEFLDDNSIDTARAYLIKKGFDQLWRVQSKAVQPLMDKWLERALDLKLPPINKFVKTVYEHYDGIIKSITSGITNAVSEGLNSVIQLARSRARGFRNVTNFCAMVYFLGNQ